MSRETPSSRSGAGRASVRHDHVAGPAEAREIDQRLHEVDLQTGGDFVSDHQRDRDSKGVADGYDDSIARRKADQDRQRRGTTRGD